MAIGNAAPTEAQSSMTMNEPGSSVSAKTRMCLPALPASSTMTPSRGSTSRVMADTNGGQIGTASGWRSARRSFSQSSRNSLTSSHSQRRLPVARRVARPSTKLAVEPVAASATG